MYSLPRSRLGRTLATTTLALVSSVWAQDEPPADSEPSFVGSVEVSVVNVDVHVTDRDGNPVPNLTVDDFEILADGEPVEITNFYAVEDGRPTHSVSATSTAEASPTEPLRDEPTEPPAEQRLHMIIFVDNFNLRPLERNRILPALRTFLLSELGDHDVVLLASYGRGLQVHHPFTSDRHELADAVLDLSETSGFRVPRDTQRRDALQRIDGADSATAALTWARNYAESEYNEIQTTVAALRDFLDSLAGLPGRKALLHVSSGVPMVPGQELYEAVDVKFPDSGAFMEMSRYDASREFDRLAAQANSHRISFYTLDAGGLRPSSFGGVEYSGRNRGGSRGRVDSALEANLQSPLRYLADRTGGRAIVNLNDVLPPLRQVGAELQTYYSLGFRDRQAGDGRYHRIEVKVDRPRVQVRHRDGYRSRSNDEQMIDRVRAALSYTVEDNPLGIEVQPGDEIRRSDGEYVVPVRIRIPLKHLALLPQPDGNHEARLRLFAAVIDDRGRASGVEEVPIGFRLAGEHVAAAQSESYLYTHRLLMREGRQKLALGVLDEIGSTHAVLSLPVQVGTAE